MHQVTGEIIIPESEIIVREDKETTSSFNYLPKRTIMSDPSDQGHPCLVAVHYDPSEVIEVRMSQPQCLTIEVRGQGKCEIADEGPDPWSHRADQPQSKVSCTLPL
ncbi:MAG: hypothetical protein HRT36_04115 [Alphaproteobacteria bacterium]|nr:hypothetical protein [Alphaproteobacteria bacterium]